MLNDQCVDIQSSLMLSNNKPRLAADMLLLLLAELTQNHADICHAFDQSRFEDALELVHKLHGACCYCGVPRLKDACKKLERQLCVELRMPCADDIAALHEAVKMLLTWHQTHDIHILFSLDK